MAPTMMMFGQICSCNGAQSLLPSGVNKARRPSLSKFFNKDAERSASMNRLRSTDNINKRIGTVDVPLSRVGCRRKSSTAAARAISLNPRRLNAATNRCRALTFPN